MYQQPAGPTPFQDYVPPVAYRRGGVEVCGRRYDEGALIFFVPRCSELRETPPEKWGVARDKLLSDTRVIDVLIHNSDRHHGHFQVGAGGRAVAGGMEGWLSGDGAVVE